MCNTKTGRTAFGSISPGNKHGVWLDLNLYDRDVARSISSECIEPELPNRLEGHLEQHERRPSVAVE